LPNDDKLTLKSVILNDLITIYSAEAIVTSNNMKLVHRPLMGGMLDLVQRGGDWGSPIPPRPLLAVPNLTAHLSTASVPITVLLYNGPLLWFYILMYPLKG